MCLINSVHQHYILTTLKNFWAAYSRFSRNSSSDVLKQVLFQGKPHLSPSPTPIPTQGMVSLVAVITARRQHVSLYASGMTFMSNVNISFCWCRYLTHQMVG